MKRTVLFFTSVLASMTMLAQQSMLDGNPVWVYQQEVGWNIKNAPNDESMKTIAVGHPSCLFHIYFLDGDTAIQNRVYKKLYHEYKDINCGYVFGTQGAELVTPLREEGNKILAPRSFYQQRWGDAEWYYEIVGSTNDEIVVYDFNTLKEGKVSTQQNEQIFSHFIEETFDTRIVDKTLRQVYQFGKDNQAMQITAGIGCSNNNVLLFAPFGDDTYLVPDELEAEIEINPSIPGMVPRYNTSDEDVILRCTWDWGASYYLILGANGLTYDDSWVRTTEDGKMMVTLEKSYTSSFLCYYVQNGKIVYKDTNELYNNYGYDYVEKYLNYHINEEEEMVDLGLSVKWATHNVGAASATDFGQYFCWGDTTGISPSDNNQGVPYIGHYLEFENHLQNHIAKTKFDAAYQLQGKNWRMPTPLEFRELINNCSCVEVRMHNVEGFLLTGPNGNTLFLPKAASMYQKYNGMWNDYSDPYAIYWTEELVANSRGYKNNVNVYKDNQLEIAPLYNNAYYPLKALPIRAVYDESGDKWLSVMEYLYYERYDLIEWGWNENDVVIPSVEACNDFIARHQELFGLGQGIEQMIRQLIRDNFRQYVADRLEMYKSRAVDTYEGSDGKTLYFVDQIDEDLMNVFDARLGQIDLIAAINLEEDDKGNTTYTKNCTYKMEDIDPKFGVPGNQYLYAIPITQAAQPYVAFNLPSLLANTNYTIRLTMAPEAIDSVAPQGNKFRINMFIKKIEGYWPTTRNYVVSNPIDPTGNNFNFTSSADSLTVIDIPLTLAYPTDVMIQIQAYVSSAETKTYTRHLRIANIEVINNGKEQMPMIAEQKTWKVGWYPTSASKVPQMVATYYFEGDTIVNGQTAKRMLCDQKATSEWDWLNKSKEYVGAWYEQNKQVYCALPGEDQFRKLYDFTSNVNERFFVYNRQTESDEESYLKALYTDRTSSYKGVTHIVGSFPNAQLWLTTWLEGVGSLNIPTANIVDEANGYVLISCKEGDEVIYLDKLLEEIIAPKPQYSRKRRIDFDHTVKIQPKAPHRAGEDLDSLYGEYNDQLLDIKLNPLDDAYLVRITDKAGQAVYEKTINAGNIVALNINISEYPEGQYTVTIENSKETFTGEFDTTTTAIKETTSDSPSMERGIFNLNGQRVSVNSVFSAPSVLPKGVYIVDGKKIFVK